MKYVFYLFCLAATVTGLGITFSLGGRANWYLHNLTGIALLSIFILYGSDHVYRKRSYLFSLNFIMISGTVVIITGSVSLITGMVLFLWNEAGLTDWLAPHLYSSIIFMVSLPVHVYSRLNRK